MASRTIVRYTHILSVLTTGLVTQPLVGAISDRSRLRWGNTFKLGMLTTGRRRPFMVAGSALVGVNLLVIGWTREIGSWFLSVDSEHYQTLVIWIAVISVYLLDFAINAGTSLCARYAYVQCKRHVGRL